MASTGQQQWSAAPLCYSSLRRKSIGHPMAVCMLVCAMQGLPKLIARRLTDWSFHVRDVEVRPHRDMNTREQLAALPAIVNHLRDLEAPGATVTVRYTGGCHELESAVIETVSTLGHMSVVPEPYGSSDGAGEHAHTHTHTHTHTCIQTTVSNPESAMLVSHLGLREGVYK